MAQFLRLREQVPPLYGLLSINAAILAYTHRGIAPGMLTLSVPAVLISACLIRMLMWMRPVKVETLDPTRIARNLRKTSVLAIVFCIAFVCWAFALDQYGGAEQHGHVAIFVAVTLLGCVFCLGFLPKAAEAVCLTVIAAFLIYSAVKGTEVLIAIAINLALVAAVILKLLRDSFNAFVELEISQRALNSERRQAQALGEENAHLAQTDALTGLPNRRYFFAMLESLLEHSGTQDPFCIGLIDLDRFKPVNDTYGHANGDRLLTILGERMAAAAPDNAILARLGGDEFGLIVMGDLDQAEAVTLRLCEQICKPGQLGDVVVSVGCSAGLASFPEAAVTANRLFDRADFALYHAKNHKRGQCVRFTEELEALIRSEQTLDTALQAADLRRELSLAFQPIVETAELEPLGVECLARWHSPLIGQVSPEQLIATAERLGRAREVTLTLFDKALDALERLPANLRLSFNLSGHDLCDASTIAALLERIASAPFPSARLLFEITETSLIEELEIARGALERLRQTGARIALDDFGTGYSSLSSLHQLPLDMVKIDRSFASQLDEAAGRRLITAIRNLARSLSLECVIEGIETENQLISARLAGFPLAQGYLIAKPMPLDDLLRSVVPNLSPLSKAAPLH
ncbi:putative bifunctional diguanylate cyclase/phosphodiesterase [Novosphingobium organovorum]|uniref:putative bifunctional diguanylate cyclase/phosphodiesterase n=1 Tax=Novosphingobium organovorum TaxID=2930092 RepID=UPI001FBB5EB6|nr:EAL domain-containing protein [Novosphingobium organovorum]